MARRSRYEPLLVYLNSRLVGQLHRKASGAIEFQYDSAWLAWPSTLPVSLSLPLREDIYTGAPVLAVFENLLPDNDAIRQRIAARVHAEGIDAYSLLGAIGHDCVGALQFLPPEVGPGPAGAVNGKAVSEKEIAGLIANLATAPLGISEDDSFRISIAGAQGKTALLFWKNRWYKPHATTPTTHIFKPSIGRLPNGLDLTYSVENEYVCLKLLAAFGLPAAKAKMAMFGDRRVLIVERFDRLWTTDGRLLRLPQEDCCQALSIPPTLKYESDGGPGVESILRLLRGSDSPAEDQRILLKATIVFWLLGATDGHAKNFSVFLSPGGRYRMTPLYDVLSAQPNVDAGQIRHNRFRLAMSVGDSRHYGIDRIAPRHFTQTALRAGVGKEVIASIFDELRESAAAVINGVIAKLPGDFPNEVAVSIRSGLERRLGTINLSNGNQA
jgi:serine/threonine-protein kinase HipA